MSGRAFIDLQISVEGFSLTISMLITLSKVPGLGASKSLMSLVMTVMFLNPLSLALPSMNAFWDEELETEVILHLGNFSARKRETEPQPQPKSIT